MTPTEIHAELTAIEKMVPGAHYVCANIYTWAEESAPITVRVSLRGDTEISATGADWKSVFAQLRANITEQTEARRKDRIRKLALDIIDLTQAGGGAQDFELRTRGFSDGELAELHTEACTVAGEMASGAPFSVSFTTGSNQPPAEAEA